MSDFRSIGEVLAILEPEFADITISKIRFLESQGLLKPERTAAGYRQFSNEDVEQLRWVLTQQRDRFLPLRVLRDRIASGDWSTDAMAPDAEPAIPVDPDTDGTAQHAAHVSEHAAPKIDLGAGSGSHNIEEVARAADLDIAAVRDLVHYGVLEPVTSDPAPVFDDDAVVIAKAAGEFMAHGVEPRHLRGWRTSADREASLLEQLAIPLLRQGSPEAVHQALTTAAELVALGGELRYALLRRALRNSLGKASGK